MESSYITKPSTAAPKPLKIKLFETPPDRRVAFVEFVLDCWMKDRFDHAILCEFVEFDEILEPYVEYDLMARRTFNAMPLGRGIAKTFGTQASRISSHVAGLSSFALGRKPHSGSAALFADKLGFSERPPPTILGVRDSG